MNILLLVFLLVVPVVAQAQTTKSRTLAGDGTPITDTVSGRLDVTIQDILPTDAATESTLGTLLLNSTFTGRLPAAFASADNVAAQTATFMHGGLMAWDSGGGNWDRLLLTSGALHVNVQNGSIAVTGTFWQATQPISAAALPLPSGAATNATLTDGTQKAIARGGAKGATSAADVTSTASGADHQPLDVVIYDTSGNAITSFGGGTQYAEDTVHVSGDTMTLAGVVRQDATAALAADGDRTLLQVDSNGHLKVSNSNPNLAADNSTNSTAKVPVLGALAGSSAPTWTNGNQVPLSVDTSGALRVTGGTSATQYTEDAASAGGESLSLAGAIRQDSPTGSTSADGDYANLKTDSVGRLWTNGSGVTQPISAASLPLPSGAATAANQDGIIRDGTGDTTQANVSSGRLHVDGSGVTQPVSGSVTVTQGTGTNLHVVCDSGCSSSAGFADNSAFTFGTTAINPIGGVLDDTATNAATENSAAVARITAQKALHMNLRNNSGTEVGTAGAPLRVDPTGSTTQPVSASSLPLPTGASTAAKQPALGTAGSASSDVLTVQGIASMTPLLVNGSGVTQPVSGTVSITTNSAVNVAQMNGVATTMGNGVSGTGVQRVTIASDSTGTVAATQATAANLNVRPDTSGATGAAPPARANYMGALGSGATGGLVVPVTACDSFANVNVSSATTTLLITGVSGRHVRICSYEITTSAANNIALISGTGATCGTGTTGMTGGTTSGTGHNMAANSGWTRGAGLGEINRTNATGDSVCVITSATAQLSGRIAYAIY